MSEEQRLGVLCVAIGVVGVRERFGVAVVKRMGERGREVGCLWLEGPLTVELPSTLFLPVLQEREGGQGWMRSPWLRSCPCPRGKRRDWAPAKQFSSSELEASYLGACVCCTCKRGCPFWFKAVS